MAAISAYVNFSSLSYDDLINGGTIDDVDHNALRGSIATYYDTTFLNIVTDLQNNYSGSTAPTDKPEGKIWCDTTTDPAVLKYFKDGASNTETLVGLTLVQTLTAKTLTSPTINGATLSGTLAGAVTFGGAITFGAAITVGTTLGVTGASTFSDDITQATTKNLLLNAATAPTALAGGLAMLNGTAASAGLANGFSLWSEDISAGNAGPHFMSEAGEILSWGAGVLDFSNGVANADRTIRLASDASILWDESADGFVFDKGIVTDTGGTGEVLKTKVIEIGDWDMDTTPGVSVSHGLTAADIRGFTGVIRSDASALFHIIGGQVVAPGILEVNFSRQSAPFQTYDTTNIFISRETGGVFDGTGYNSTSFNRGWITITYAG